MPGSRKPDRSVPLRLTQAHRKAVAERLPQLAGRGRVEGRGQRSVDFTPDELQAIHAAAGVAVGAVTAGTRRNSLRLILTATTKAIARAGGAGATPVYQLQVTLLDS